MGNRLLLSALAAALVACDGSAPTEGAGPELSTETFVAVMVELRAAERDILGAATDADSAAFEARKAEILENHSTSEDEIRAFVERQAEDLDRLHALWETLSVALRHVPTPDTTRSLLDSLLSRPAETTPTDTRRPPRARPRQLPSPPDSGG